GIQRPAGAYLRFPPPRPGKRLAAADMAMRGNATGNEDGGKRRMAEDFVTQGDDPRAGVAQGEGNRDLPPLRRNGGEHAGWRMTGWSVVMRAGSVFEVAGEGHFGASIQFRPTQ